MASPVLSRPCPFLASAQVSKLLQREDILPPDKLRVLLIYVITQARLRPAKGSIRQALI